MDASIIVPLLTHAYGELIRILNYMLVIVFTLLPLYLLKRTKSNHSRWEILVRKRLMTKGLVSNWQNGELVSALQCKELEQEARENEASIPLRRPWRVWKKVIRGPTATS